MAGESSDSSLHSSYQSSLLQSRVRPNQASNSGLLHQNNSSGSSAPQTVNTASRVVIDDQITRGLQDYLKCGICYQILTQDKKPKECSQCRNTLSCSDCINGWLNQNPSCPYCKQQYPVFEEVSPTMLGLLSTVRFNCKNKKKGCIEVLTLQRELAKHEAVCSFNEKESSHDEAVSTTSGDKRQCKFCNKRVDKNGFKDHSCNAAEQQWCEQHKQNGYHIGDSRIANYEDCKRNLDIFKCQLCKSLLKRPLSCQKCKTNFCQICLGQAYLKKRGLISSAFCPECYCQDARFHSLSKNLTNIMNSSFKIYCKNRDSGCDKILPYDELESHEMVCTACDRCKTKCLRCSTLLSFEDKEAHVCPQLILDSINSHQNDDEPNNSLSVSLLNPSPPLAINAGDNLHLLDDRQPREALTLSGYFRNVKQDTQSYVLDLRGVRNIWLVLAILIFDFFLQNFLVLLYITYFLEIDNFVNRQSRFVFFIQGSLYLVITLSINFILLLSRRWSRDIESDQTSSKYTQYMNEF